MADSPKPGSLWARIMGLNERDDATSDAAPEPVVPEEPAAVDETPTAVVETIEVDAEVVDDDAVSLAEETPSDGPATAKYTGMTAPVPPFAQNPLEESLLNLGVRDVPLAAPIVLPPPAPRAPTVTAPLATPVAPPAPFTTPIAAPVVTPFATPVAPPLPPCQSCGTPRKAGLSFCDDCGYLFPTEETAALAVAAASSEGPLAPLTEPLVAPLAAPMAAPAATPEAMPSLRIRDRYLLGQFLSEKSGVKRYRGLDASSEPSTPVVIVTARVEDEAPPVAAVAEPVEDDILPTFDADLSAFDTVPPTVPMAEIQSLLAWPRPSWERGFLNDVNSPRLPAVIEYFLENGSEYLILEEPQGQLLWDAWDDPDVDSHTRYGWLKQVAEVVESLQKAGAMIECLSPDHVVVDNEMQIRLANIGDLIPLPIPPNAPIRGTLYTPPELILSPETADARASLYSLGAMLYSLEYLHHGLEEKDFESKYVPKQITDRFPDVHPLFPRLVNKLFVKEPAARFPTDEASRTDPSGIKELMYTLTVCQRVFDSVRLDMSAWTTTGMIRTGNEDAFAFLHGVDSRQDDLHEYALVLVCDGMGGYDAGEVAAAMAIARMKEFFLQQPMFSALAGKDAFPGPVDVAAAKKLFEAGLKHANKEVFTASRTPGKGKRGMGCTAEAVYVDAHHIFVGHVGDSRVYHLKEGRLVQLTRDQTLVNRLVELGQIKAEDAENHPRKNELQQAIGGQPDVHPGVYHSRIKRGDWVLVCSDGLSNHISNQELEKMLTREASNSAEEAARRLLNLVNLRGATDNATIVVIRAT